MQRYNKLRDNLYSTDLIYGKIELKPTYGFSCFFIVEHTLDMDFIKDQAIQLLLAGCQDFHFYGKTEANWRLGVDEVNMLLHPESTSETDVLISGWNTLEEFVDALKDVLSLRPFVPHNVYLIYDDEEKYRNVLKKLDVS